MAATGKGQLRHAMPLFRWISLPLPHVSGMLGRYYLANNVGRKREGAVTARDAAGMLGR
ncbi:hypothetical protein RAC89_20825 [Paenibacillus sp. GD4]|uniref:hypothetical protein n=1 Tax=Paenibacillus sp. GD4 TaxID=3068890 RepID=UPI0027964974|nr:hypothetical protein [Paenibacillus sp. GD4]MDQ1912840.1 hypothetical protein [Paenibacillus sp. GD4]